MQTLLEGLDQREISANLITGQPSVYAMYLAVADERGVPWDCLRGTLQNFVLTGFSHGPKVKDNMRYSVDMIDFAARHQPFWNPLSISVRNVRDAGCTAVQEMAFGLAGGMAYIDHMLERGHEIDKFASRITFFLNAHNDLFEEVCKYRAMRRMWARIMKERYGAKNPKSWMMRFHVQTSGDSLTAQQPLNNIVRTSLQALAAVLGGAQSMHVNSVDEAFAIPTEEAAVLSLRTQQIILYESGVANTVDPLGGSFYIENLTDRMEEEARKLVEKIDGMGGMVEACASGWVARQTQDAAWEYQKQVENKERIIVGVNEFKGREEDIPIDVFEIDPLLEKKQVERLKKVLNERDQAKAEKAKRNLLEVCRGRENSMPATIEAVKAYVTVGEIGRIYDEAFGREFSSSCASRY
jgi:methylmalonyl-CoA mutase N-terminal domain/subunit